MAATRSLALRTRTLVDIDEPVPDDLDPRAIPVRIVNKPAPSEPTVEVPEPPADGTFVLTSTDGVLSWEEPAGGG